MTYYGEFKSKGKQAKYGGSPNNSNNRKRNNNAASINLNLMLAALLLRQRQESNLLNRIFSPTLYQMSYFDIFVLRQ